MRTRRRVRVRTTRARRTTGDVLQDAQRRSVGRGTTRRRGKPAKPPAARRRARGSNPDVDDKGKNKGEGARARSTPPRTDPETTKGRATLASPTANAASPIASPPPRACGTASRRFSGRPAIARDSVRRPGRCSRRPASTRTNARVWRRWTTRRARRSSRGSSRRGTPKSTTRSRGSRQTAAGAPVAAPSPWPALRRGQRETVRWLAARHLAGLGGVVANGVGAGKRLATLAHLLHLRDGLGLRGPHLLACPRENAATWIADLNRWCPNRSGVARESRGRADVRQGGGCARGDRRRHRADGRVDRIERGARRQGEGGEGNEGGEGGKGSEAEEEEKDAAAVNTRTDPDAGASDPTAVPSKRRKKSGKTRKSSDRRSRVKEDASDGVLPAAARASFRCLIVDADGGRGGDAPRARRGVARASRRLFPRRRRRRRRASAPPSTPTPRETFAPRSRWFSPNRSPPRTPVDERRRERARPEAHHADAASLSPRLRRRPTRFSVLFYASTTTPRTTLGAPRRTRRSFAFASQSERRRRVKRRRASRRCRRCSRDSRATRRRMLIVATSRSTLDAASAALGDARVAHVRLDVASRGARLHAAARFRADASPPSTSRRLRALACATGTPSRISRKMW